MHYVDGRNTKQTQIGIPRLDLSRGEIPQVSKCATLMDKNKKQKNRDSPPTYEPKNFHQGYKRAMLIVDIKYKNNRDSPPGYEPGKKFPGFEKRHVNGKHNCISKPEEFFSGSNLGGKSLSFCFLCLSINVAHFKTWEIFPKLISRRGIYILFRFVCLSSP